MKPRAPTRSEQDDLNARIDALLARYGARNPQVFGSVARGEASGVSDLDLLVVLDPGGGNPLLRVAGLAEELSEPPASARRCGRR